MKFVKLIFHVNKIYHPEIIWFPLIRTCCNNRGFIKGLTNISILIQITKSRSGSGNQFRNGTCFTAAECNEKGGMNSGSCAGGYEKYNDYYSYVFEICF